MYPQAASRTAAEALTHLFGLFGYTHSSAAEASARLGPQFALSPSLVTNSKQLHTVPSLDHLYAISELHRLTLGGTFQIFGIDLDLLAECENRLNGHRTRLIGSYPFSKERRVEVPKRLADEEMFGKSNYLWDLVQEWQEVPIRAIENPAWQREGFVYARLGTSDRTASPTLPPGATLQIRLIADGEKFEPDPGCFYFLQHGYGYLCCRCVIERGRLFVLSTDSGYFGLNRFLYPGQVKVLGIVTAFAAPLPPPVTLIRPLQKYSQPAALVSPWNHQSLSGLLSAERRRFGISNEQIDRTSGIVRDCFGFGISSKTAHRHNAANHYPHTRTILALSAIYSLRFVDVLRSCGLALKDSQRFGLEALLTARTVRDLAGEFPNAGPPLPGYVWDKLMAEWNEWPTPLSLAFPRTRVESYEVLRLDQSAHYRGLDPVIKRGSLVMIENKTRLSLDRLKQGEEKQDWDRPIFVLKVAGAHLCSYLHVDENSLTLVPHPAASDVRRLTFRRRDVAVLGVVAGIASSLCAEKSFGADEAI